MEIAVGSCQCHTIMTYYPRMPGNSTRCPAEKMQLQAGYMDDSFFLDTQRHLCRVTTLSHILSQRGIRQIELLKVHAAPECFD